VTLRWPDDAPPWHPTSPRGGWTLEAALSAADHYADEHAEPLGAVTPRWLTAPSAPSPPSSTIGPAKAASRATPSHLPLGQVRPGSRLLETERKLLTHAIRISAYNTESALARLIRPHYARGQDEARALMREAFPGDLQIIDKDPAGPARPRQRPPTQQSPRRPLCRTHRNQNPLPRHRPDPRLQRQRAPRDCMNDLTLSGVLESTPRVCRPEEGAGAAAPPPPRHVRRAEQPVRPGRTRGSATPNGSPIVAEGLSYPPAPAWSRQLCSGA